MQVGYAKNAIPDEYLAVLDICVLVLTAYLPRDANWSISWSFPYQLVDINGVRKHMHADKLRKYHIHVN